MFYENIIKKNTTKQKGAKNEKNSTNFRHSWKL